MRWVILLALCSIAGAQVSADFHNRDNTTAMIPTLWQGANTFSHLDVTSAAQLTGAGIKVSREFILLSNVWANCPSPCTPDYTNIDGTATISAARGYKLIISIEYTPPDLGASTCTPPSNNATWATRAAAAIAHVDGLHPGLVVDWEIWNEPDTTAQLCPGAGTNLAAYLPIYAAAAPAMQAQVVTDGSSALVGGPALSSPNNAPTWFANTSTGLLGNSGTSPYVQFVSYHSYIGGCTVSWSACFTALQSATTGQNAFYSAINTQVRAGSQPSASTTPILVTEYNDSASFSSDPVRNDATNGPLWNAVSLIDWFNAASIPTQVDYYAAATSGPSTWFCLLGNLSAGDCTNPPFNPYPQFFLYSLVHSTQFLGLVRGGHLATSVTPGSSTSGLQSAAWYTPTADVMLLANPTGSDINGQTVTFTNSGFASSAGVQFLLNAANSTITPSAFSGSVNIPANSTVAVMIAPPQSLQLMGKPTVQGKVSIK